jgi:protein-tyrosine phosphatase
MNPIRPWLYISNYRATLNRSLLQAYNIQVLLQFAAPTAYPDLLDLYLPVEDGVPLDAALLAQGVQFVRRAYKQGQTTLIACGAGISRSASFATAVVKEVEELPLLHAWQIVAQAHPPALPHPALWDSLCEYYHEPVSIFEMLSSRRALE